MFLDISCNITDNQFKDIDKIINNCKKSNTIPFFVGVDYQTSVKACEYAEKYKTLFYAGIHPLHSLNSTFMPIVNERLIAIGECGLDYYRLEYSPKEIQKKVFIEQLNFKADRYFLHSRDSHRDLMEILSDFSVKAVVHSFTGTIEECDELVKKGYFIGINGCSLKTEEGIEVVKNLPLEHLLVETDSPYCKIRKSYAGFNYLKNYTKSKINEPSLLKEVVEVISEIKDIDIKHLEHILMENNTRFFGDKFEWILQDWNS